MKIAHNIPRRIDDTPISTVLTVAFGSKIPIIMGLAMHRSMYENAAVKKNMNFLRKKIDFPRIKNGFIKKKVVNTNTVICQPMDSN